MSRLALQQQALLGALFAWPASDATKKLASYVMDSGGRGLKVYQANGHSLAHRQLLVTYPVLAQLLGDESFSDLACALWHAQPPQCGDVGLWGAGLAEFVASSVQLQDEPFLADVARVEWVLHQCASGPDAQADLSTLVLLTEQDPAAVGMVLASGCAVVRSPWPVASIVGAHLDGQPTLQDAAAQLRDGVAQDVVVWRANLRPQVRLAVAGEADLLQAWLCGMSVDDALSQAGELDFSQWLPLAVQSGLLLSLQYLPSVREHPTVPT